MNKTIAAAILAAASLTSVASFAENLDNPAFPVTQGAPVSRAQVQAELAQYQQQLASAPARAETPRFVAQDNAPSVSRAQVQAELNAWENKQAQLPARAEDRVPV